MHLTLTDECQVEFLLHEADGDPADERLSVKTFVCKPSTRARQPLVNSQ